MMKHWLMLKMRNWIKLTSLPTMPTQDKKTHQPMAVNFTKIPTTQKAC